MTPEVTIDWHLMEKAPKPLNTLGLRNLLMQKKGQIALFILAGAVVLILMILLVVNLNSLKKQDDQTDSNNIETYVESLLERMLENSLKEISRHGGHHNISANSTLSFIQGEVRRVAFADSGIVSKDRAAEELCDAVEERLEGEINLSFLEKRGANYTTGEMNCSGVIGNGRTIAELNYPVNISIDGSKRKVEHFRADINVPLGKAIEKANEIVQEINFPSTLDLGDYDYSCEKIRVCHIGDTGIMRITHYEPWSDRPSYNFYFAVSADVAENSCTSLSNVNNNNC